MHPCWGTTQSSNVPAVWLPKTSRPAHRRRCVRISEDSYACTIISLASTVFCCNQVGLLLYIAFSKVEVKTVHDSRCCTEIQVSTIHNQSRRRSPAADQTYRVLWCCFILACDNYAQPTLLYCNIVRYCMQHTGGVPYLICGALPLPYIALQKYR